MHRRIAMSKYLTSLFLIVGLLLTQAVSAEELSLYDSKAEAIAYIDTSDDMTIYLWGGDPVAYYEDGSIWGFNGNHLGWFTDGIIIDHKGYAVGAVKGAVNMLYQLESLKSLKSLKYLKSLKELAPLKPLEKNMWSPIPLSLFLAGGK